MLILIETVGGEMKSPRLYADRFDQPSVRRAHRHFNAIAEAGSMQEHARVDLANEASGTVRLAGDDAHSVQMFSVGWS